MFELTLIEFGIEGKGTVLVLVSYTCLTTRERSKFT
jgi:hypothetical protein